MGCTFFNLVDAVGNFIDQTFSFFSSLRAYVSTIENVHAKNSLLDGT